MALIDVCQVQGQDGEWFLAPEFIGCCDCGLVHSFEYKVVDGRVLIKARREPRLTSEARAVRVFEYAKKEDV